MADSRIGVGITGNQPGEWRSDRKERNTQGNKETNKNISQGWGCVRDAGAN